MEEFVEKQLSLINLEREEELSQGISLLSTKLRNVRELESKGICVSKLDVQSKRIGLYGRQIVTFEASHRLGKAKLPINSISNGDIVGVYSNGESLLPERLVTGIVVKSTETVINVAFEDLPDEIKWNEHDSTLQLVKLANDVTYKRLKRVLNDIKSTQNKVSCHLTEVLFQASPLSPVNPRWSSLIEKLTSGTLTNEDIVFFNPSLDFSQKKAVLFALSRPDVAIIHGPPGTGKTTTVIEFILQSVAIKEKVLACAPSNIAVDNLVERLGSYGIKVIRLGHPARLVPSVLQYSLDNLLSTADGADIVLDVRRELSSALTKVGEAKNSTERHKWRSEAKTLKKELIEREEKLLKELLKRADVILTTNTGSAPEGPLKNLPEDHFNVVVIDECAQSLEASCWIPIVRAPKCVLAGDHKQLPPTILSEKASKSGLSVTLMERLVDLFGDNITSLLTMQYRMNYNIMKWPSIYLYGDALMAHDSVATHLLKDIPNVLTNALTVSSLFFIDTAGCGISELETSSDESKGNEGEAELVLAHAKELLEAGVPAKEIAVIAPYNLQVDIIRKTLESSSIKLEVHTVDGFQGREKEAVIISFTRSNVKGQVGFLKEQRRTNVAVTRARRHLAMIGDSETISNEPFIKGLLNYCSNHGEVRSAHEYIHTIENLVDTISVETVPELEIASNVTKMNQETTTDNAKQQKALYEKRLKDFLKSDQDTTMEFPSTLSSQVRKLIHELSEELGLLHVSEGDGKDRHIVVSKPLKQEPTVCTTSKLQHSNGIESSPNNTSCAVNSDQPLLETQVKQTVSKLPTTPPATTPVPAGVWKCSICGFAIPETNKELHQLRCEREQRQIETIMKDTKFLDHATSSSKKKQANSKKSKTTKTVTPTDTDDLDSLLEEMKEKDRKCNFPGCKKSANHLGIKCPFCKGRFCMTHNMAEVHGCEENARRHARQELEKQLRGNDSKGKRKLDPTRRVQLQKKLDKKIDDLSSGRQRKKPSSS